MENKYFKCFKCDTVNNYYVHKIKKEKECKCCQTYNFFKQKNSKKNNNIINKFQNNSNKNLKIIKQSQIHYNGYANSNHLNKNLKIIPQSQIQYNGICNINNNLPSSTYNSSNINPSNSLTTFAQVSSLNPSFNRMNINNYLENYIAQLNSLLMNIPSTLDERYVYLGDILYDKIERFPIYQNYEYLFSKIVGMLLALDQLFIVKLIINDRLFQIKVQEAINLIEENCTKIIGQKKEKLTQDMIINNKKDFECTICLETIKLNEDINTLKCGHIFHYKCIEKLIIHNFNKCPNCRSYLKTEEKKPNNLNNNN